METNVNPSLKKLLVVVLVVVLFGMWAINTLNTGNAFWFLPFQPEYRPSRIIVRDHGRAVTLLPGEEAYEKLTLAVNASFSDFANSSLIDIGLSEETLQRYHQQDLVLELYYPQFITFNTPVRMSKVNQLLFPVRGRHEGRGYLFMGRDGRWLAGAMQLRDTEPIMLVMAELGYLDNE